MTEHSEGIAKALDVGVALLIRSAPAIIAQSFRKKSFIIFGATRPEYMHLSEYAVPIYDRNRHKLCQHNSRKEEIDCCEEFCMERIRVDAVLNQIRQNV